MERRNIGCDKLHLARMPCFETLQQIASTGVVSICANPIKAHLKIDGLRAAYIGAGASQSFHAVDDKLAAAALVLRIQQLKMK